MLHAKFKDLVGLVARYRPDSPSLKQWRLYLMRWDQCVGEPRREMPADHFSYAGKEEEEIDPLWTTPVYGIPWEKLVAARQAIWDLKMEDKPANRHLAAWALFLCGLIHGTTYTLATKKEAEHGFDDGLPQAARESWDDGVDFALSEGTEKIIAETPAPFESKEVAQLYLGVAHASIWSSPDVESWLTQWDERDAKLRLLVAMGVLAATSDYGGRLLQSIEGVEPLLILLQIRPGLADIIRDFVYEAGEAA